MIELAAADRVLELLRGAALPYRWHETNLSRWDSCCPRCLSGTWDLVIIDRGSSVKLCCRSAGCSEREIIAALKERPALREAQLGREEALQFAEAASAIAHRALELAAERIET
jgi:hypothetical protein